MEVIYHFKQLWFAVQQYFHSCPLLLQVLVKLRKMRYGRTQDDISVLVLGNEGVLGHTARSRQPVREGLRPPASFLLIRCTKNNSTKLTQLEAEA